MNALHTLRGSSGLARHLKGVFLYNDRVIDDASRLEKGHEGHLIAKVSTSRYGGDHVVGQNLSLRTLKFPDRTLNMTSSCFKSG